MLERPPFSAAVLLLCFASTQAGADIYIYQDGDDPPEIRLSNMPDMEGYQLLVAESDHISATPRHAAIPPPVQAVALPYDGAVQAAARETGLEPALIHAVIATESRHQPLAVSPRGARGLMQLMPATARAMRINNPDNPEQNILGGARYLRTLLDEFGELPLALAAYNAGPTAVRNAGMRIPVFRETRRYVPLVLQHYHRLKRI
jgi:soluble lytic murein transglycosylase-like protein